MRFMILIKANDDTEAGVPPSREVVEAMGRFNEELVKAGVMLAAEGLHSSAKGARMKFSGEKRTVTDGPFTESKELIAGFWLIEVTSREEAIEWASRIPSTEGEVEIRQVFEMSDFPPDVLTPEEAAREQALRMRTRAAKA
ncbi:MAG TPA: YciI family protein [Candidatus Dormibacteraeota bacterium]